MNPIGRWRERNRVERELSEEMAAHVEERVEELMEDGYSEREARAKARQAFGNTTLQKESSRQAWGWNGIEQLVQDVRHGVRVLKQNPGFTATALVVLTLGIGMNTAMFSAVKAVLLSGLPYPHPERLVELRQSSPRYGLQNVSGPDFRDWREQSRSFEHMASYDGELVTLVGAFAPRRISMGVVSRGFFESLRVPALVGRVFGPDEQKPGGTPAAVVGYALAQTAFGSVAASMGKAIRIDGMAFTVIGVMPPGFDFPERAQVWIPQEFFNDTSARSAHNYHVLGRLKEGVTLERAQNEMNIIAARLGSTYIDDRGQGIKAKPLYDEVIGPVRPAFMVLSAAVALVLLIACVNIANLQLARATTRMRELALRAALGAGRRRLLRQLLTENVLLSCIGGAGGLLLALFVMKVLRSIAPPNIPRLETMAVDGTVLYFAAALAIGTGLLFGMLPALIGSRTDVNDSLKEGGGKHTAGLRTRSWGSLLVTGQVGLAMILLAGAALLIKSYWKLAHVDSGLTSQGVFTADLMWPTADGNSVDGKKVAQSSRQILAEVSALPGVQGAALIYPLPVQSGGPDGDFEIEGRPLPADPHQNPDAFYRLATGSYFEAFGIPLLEGRTFTAQDDTSQAQVAIVNQTFAKKFFPGEDVAGKRIRFMGFDRKPQFMTIVGLVPDVRSLGLSRPPDAEVFADYVQHADSSMDATLVVRGPASNEPAVREIVKRSNRDTPVEFANMIDVISGTIARERFQTLLLGAFAGLAMMLAIVGIYGLLSYMVTRRTAEIGIRVVLGADRATVAGMVLAQGGKMIVPGVAIGLSGAALLTRVLESLLFQVKASDAQSFVTVTLIFGAAAMVGCYLPARRAAKIDPKIALRHE